MLFMFSSIVTYNDTQCLSYLVVLGFTFGFEVFTNCRLLELSWTPSSFAS